MTLQPFPVRTAGSALILMAIAHSQRLKASWHPSGGMTATKDRPVTHTVWVLGSAKAIRKFKESIS